MNLGHGRRGEKGLGTKEKKKSCSTKFKQHFPLLNTEKENLDDVYYAGQGLRLNCLLINIHGTHFNYASI